MLYWVRWGPDGRILGSLLRLRDQDVNGPLGLEALKGSHDAFHLLVLLSQLLPELLKHRVKETESHGPPQSMCNKKPNRVGSYTLMF